MRVDSFTTVNEQVGTVIKTDNGLMTQRSKGRDMASLITWKVVIDNAKSGRKSVIVYMNNNKLWSGSLHIDAIMSAAKMDIDNGVDSLFRYSVADISDIKKLTRHEDWLLSSYLLFKIIRETNTRSMGASIDNLLTFLEIDLKS
jgi:hypothetical protein